MTFSEFIQLVDRMRVAQRAYFRTRRTEHLEESKQLEREVDAAIKELQDRQPKLFA